MRLKSITLKGFKSFPDRTELEFGPGVSVVVGPNGSGKSNVTDAVLWAMGEQSPLAVRGQSMQDVIFGGGRGVQARGEAEVEIVLDNSDGGLELPLSEISIARRLDRTGEGGYRLNGARCRLSDVIELLSDTGLGKETHSIISQGRVDSIVTSKPRDRRLLIEEAAGLGKHRKRRRRAQLKLERTQENLDRALDVEREARTRLRPLKRQAEAAELHERLERQTLEARLELVRDAARTSAQELASAEQSAAEARAARAELERELAQTGAQRGEAERALAERAERHDALARLLYDARSARERIGLRGEQLTGSSQRLQARIEQTELRLRELAQATDADPSQPGAGEGAQRLHALEAELAQIAASREQEIEGEIASLRLEHDRQAARGDEIEAQTLAARDERELADARARSLRERLSACERGADDARREAERVGGELAAVNQFLRSHVRAGREDDGPGALSDELSVKEGYELALAAALAGRLDAALVSDVAGAQALLDRAGPDGATVLLAELHNGAGAHSEADARQPAAGAVPLLELLSGPHAVMKLARRLLADAWVVERLADLPTDFQGIAATREGRVWFASLGELRQLTEGGSERVLARRNERTRLTSAAEQAAQAELGARAECERVRAQLRAAEDTVTAADDALRESERLQTETGEARRRAEWLIEQRRAAPAQGPLAVRRAELEGELAAERRQAERAASEQRERLAQGERMRAQLDADVAALPCAKRLAAALLGAGEAVQARIAALEEKLAGDTLAGEEMASALRAFAAREAEIQARLSGAGELVTEAEVVAQRMRDRAGETQLELDSVIKRLGSEPTSTPTAVALSAQERDALDARVERLTRRREQLGPVNPLAQQEHAEALAHVEELESQRSDLETALRELRAVIRETDRQIQETFKETFAAAARNFEELVGDVFPGGSGRLRLIDEERSVRPVLGGESLPGGREDANGNGAGESAAEAEMEAELRGRAGDEEDLPGVEIEITPAGKSTKRLSLLSGGEKSMTALAFVFAVFLARPCPFYILDEVEAALDDTNLDRFLALLRRYSQRAQFIVITHQKRTMEAADCLYGVSMGSDGVSKVLSRRLPSDDQQQALLA
ncbi:MAG: chromosome segregation protein [Solirubrobacteraceae bacterium]|nr:chromosome segregation protein [Solirubrobacteraceae bacterium]